MSLIARISALLIVLASCSGNDDLKVPKNILPKDTMVAVLTDMHIIEGAKTGRDIMGDSLKADIYFAKLYHKHGTTKARFDSSFSFYSRHPEVMDEMYDRVIERLNKIQLQPPRTPLTEEADTPATKRNSFIDTPQTLKELTDSARQAQKDTTNKREPDD